MLVVPVSCSWCTAFNPAATRICTTCGHRCRDVLDQIDAPQLRRILRDHIEMFEQWAREAIVIKHEVASCERERERYQGQADVARQVVYSLRTAMAQAAGVPPEDSE